MNVEPARRVVPAPSPAYHQDMVDSPSTMILRFRDLVTADGGTVTMHNEISAANGFVWWGWWNKSGETVPDDVFRQLNAKAKSTGLQILFLDSGREKVFTAKCLAIEWDKEHRRINSPDPTRTPQYYSSQSYFAWLKLETVSELSDEDLQKYTYVRVDEFFENHQSRYTPFYGKRIQNPDELRMQDRTIWFVRPFNPRTDLVHALVLLNAKQIAPSHFETEFAKSKSFNLLWVSDLHFCKDSVNHGFPLKSSTTKHDLGQAIEEAAKRHSIHDFAGVLLSGDITWSADPEEFSAARQFLTRIGRSPSSLDNYRFAICPGNHDIRFSDAPSDKAAAVNDAVAPEKIA